MKIRVTIMIALLTLFGCGDGEAEQDQQTDAGSDVESSTVVNVMNHTTCSSDQDCVVNSDGGRNRCIFGSYYDTVPTNGTCTSFCEEHEDCGYGWWCSKSSLTGSMTFEGKNFCVPGCEVYNTSRKCSQDADNPIVTACEERCWIDDENCERHCIGH